jgi:cell division protein FtsN
VAAAPPTTTTTSAVSTPATNDSAPAATPTSTDNRYYLQVGVHRTKAEALQQKANLILSEVSPKLVKVLGGNGRYRVIIGPYDNLDSAVSERSDLRQNNINSSLMKDLKK